MIGFKWRNTKNGKTIIIKENYVDETNILPTHTYRLDLSVLLNLMIFLLHSYSNISILEMISEYKHMLKLSERTQGQTKILVQSKAKFKPLNHLRSWASESEIAWCGLLWPPPQWQTSRAWWPSRLTSPRSTHLQLWHVQIHKLWPWAWGWGEVIFVSFVSFVPTGMF